jgi:hypothetical protein
MLLRMLIVCFLLSGFAVAFAEIARQTQEFSPKSPCQDGASTCLSNEVPTNQK